jgi:hypothetical protein
MIARSILICLLLCGCASTPPKRSAEETRAEQVGRLFAVDSLGLSKAQVEKMRADFGFSLEHGRAMTIQFYDPKVFRPNSDGFFVAMDGGFPSYFRVTVDIQKWQVIDHYASRR